MPENYYLIIKVGDFLFVLWLQYELVCCHVGGALSLSPDTSFFVSFPHLPSLFLLNCHKTILRFLTSSAKKAFLMIHPYGHIKYLCTPLYFPASFAVRLRPRNHSGQLVVSWNDEFHFRAKGFQSQCVSFIFIFPYQADLEHMYSRCRLQKRATKYVLDLVE